MPALSNSQHYSSIWQHGRMIGLNKPLLHNNLFWGPAKILSEAEMWDECDKARSRLLHRSASVFRRRVGADSTFWPLWLQSLPSILLHLPGGHRRGLTWLLLQSEGRQWGRGGGEGVQPEGTALMLGEVLRCYSRNTCVNPGFTLVHINSRGTIFVMTENSKPRNQCEMYCSLGLFSPSTKLW